MYVFRNTERTNQKASEYETKSLLYLIGQSRSRNEISLAAIDCFNDVTGIDEDGKKLWDVQSKGEAKLTPRKIGKYLVTLFDNYQSNLCFFEYIFFMPRLNGRYLEAHDKHTYKVSAFKKDQAVKVHEGLVTELERQGKSYSDHEVDNFLGIVILVEDRKNTATYVKDIVRFRHQGDKDKKFYEEIFREIRNLQSAKKNSLVEGMTVVEPLDVLEFDRHIQVGDLKMLVINRFVGVDLFDQKMMPPSFLEVIKDQSYDLQDLQDIILESKSQIGKAFFDKNQKKEFWNIFEHIISCLRSNPDIPLPKIIETLSINILHRLSHLDEKGILFLSAMIKDGLASES
ncbi:Uncharacterised protein [BD1-7 clade bacterium]|uniref:CD-NTase associated protein 4-like DNA endonuclease domain-containing protein n=1 Tax=BD1-7 clade bacterium TaxID=2029982 RepID=A0A5S9N4C6_9GAMM|nr:Uncharacterised protein [BD1-7 clade bacterium]CAA0084591.1 Uncharacterised protein [BD1-7 clade bacterium]